MRHIVVWGGLVIVAMFLLVYPPQAQAVRYASCDACGLCVNPDGSYKMDKGNPAKPVIPQAWPACARCLYGIDTEGPTDLAAFVDAKKDSTLAIEDTVDEVSGKTTPGQNPPPTIPGKYFTQLGCFDIGSEFDNPNISASVISQLLTIIQGVTGAIGFIYLLYGIFLILTSQGDVVKLNAGRQAVIWAIVGTVFTILAVFVVRFVAVDLLRIPGIQ